MTKFYLLLVFFHLAFAITSTMNNALRNQVVIALKDAMLPYISQKIQHLKLPDIQGKESGIEYKVRNINLHVNPIHANQIGIAFVPPSILRLTGNSFGLKGSAVAQVKFLFLSKTVDVEISVSNANFVIGITLTAANNKPNIVVSQFNLGLSSGNVGIKIKGGIIGAIINLLVKLLKGHVVRSVVRSITSEVPPLVTKEVNQMLNRLPDDIRIDDKVRMKYQFPTAPKVKDGYLFTGISAYLHPVNDPSPPPGPISQMPEFDAKNPKNIQFFLSDYIVRSAVNTAYKLGMMNIQISKKLADRQVSMACKVTRVPDFKFAGSIQVTADAICTVALDNDPKPKFEVSATLQIKLTEKIEKAVIYFHADKLEFTKLDFKIIQPIDIQWFKDRINEVIAIILAVINGQLGQQGIPLPVIKEIDYKDIIQYIGNGYTMIGTNPVFHFTLDPNEKGIIDHSSETVVVDDKYWIEEAKE